MGRSLKKGPFVNEKLLKKILKAQNEGAKKAIKTWARSSTISPEMVGVRLAIHDGKNFQEVSITESMVGHRVGEFATTRRFTGHSKKGKIAKSTGTTGRVATD